MDPSSAELQALTSKRESLKDRRKKRKEALEGILNQTNNLVTTPKLVKDKDPKDAAQGGANHKEPPKDAPKPKPKEETTTTPSKKAKLNDENTLISDEGSSKPDDTLPPDEPIAKEEEDLAPPPPPPSIERHKKRSSQDSCGSATSNSSSSLSKAASREKEDDILSLLSQQSAKEKEEKKQREEIHELLSKPTAKEMSLMDTFRSASGGGVKEFCTHSTKDECMKVTASSAPCDKLHFAKIIQAHTDETLGDCSFLNTCFHMDTCKYIHYKVDEEDMRTHARNHSEHPVKPVRSRHLLETLKLVPPQWVQCDLRNLHLSVLGEKNAASISSQVFSFVNLKHKPSMPFEEQTVSTTNVQIADSCCSLS